MRFRWYINIDKVKKTKPLNRGVFIFCSTPSASPARPPPFCLPRNIHWRRVGKVYNPASAWFIHFLVMSLLALALVEPTQCTTQLASRPYFLCPPHHACHLRNLAELSSSSTPLWRMASGAVSGSQHVGSGSPGGTSRSALGAINAVGGVDEFEQP